MYTVTARVSRTVESTELPPRLRSVRAGMAAQRRLAGLGAALAGAVLGLAGPESCGAVADETLARQLLVIAGRERGVALVADGSGLAPALVAASGMIVVDQQADEERRAAAALAADKAGTLGRRLYVVTGTPAACVLADGYADLVVLGTATDATLTPESAKELARVTAPYGGTLVVGNPGGEAAGLTKPALTAWAARLGAEIRSEGGLWAVWKRPALPGGDDWTHWYGDAGGNPANNDTALTYPFELAWTAKPMATTRTQNRAAAAGRLFTLFRQHQKEGMFQTHRFEGAEEVVARSIANGEILWRYPLGDDAYAMRSSIVATPAVVYVMRRERVVVLDAQTGRERAPIVLTSAPGEVKSIWLRDGVLVALVGPTRDIPEFCPTANVQATIGKFKQITGEASYGFGDTLIAWDTGAGKERWRWQAPAPVDSRVVGITPGGLVLAYAKDSAVFGLNLQDGKERWQQKDATVLASLAQLDPSEHWGYNMVSRPGLAMTDAVALIAHGGSAQIVALSPKDGAPLWDAKRNYHFPVQTVIVGNKVAATCLAAGTFLDAATGEAVNPDPKKQMNLSGENNASCGQVTASGRYIVGCSGGPLYEIESQKKLLSTMVKAECGLGNLVTAGTMVQVPGACSGCNRVMGFLAMRSFSKLDLRTPADDLARLEKGPGQPGPAVAVDVKDWPTRRHDALRSAGSPVSVTNTAAIRWQWKPPTPYLPTAGNIANVYPQDAEYRVTQPVTVGDLVVVAGGEGVVTALDRATGNARWRAALSARIHASPTIAGGRVFVGCTDGSIHVLSTGDGRLIWRYRIAPQDRRVMTYGHLESSWPVVCSPLVDGDTVYAAAGRPMVPGGYVVALDVATGTPRWMQSYIPYSGEEPPPYRDPSSAENKRWSGDSPRQWIVPFGELALQGDRLVVRTRSSAGISGLILDRRTGQPATKGKTYDHNSQYGFNPGGETAILPSGMIIGGGHKVEVDQNAHRFGLGSTGAAVVDPDGTVRVGLLQEAIKGSWQPRNVVIPCWLGNRMALPGFGPWGLQAQDMDAWQAAVAPQLMERPPHGYALNLGLSPTWGPVSPDNGQAVTNSYGKVGTAALGVVMAENAVLATSRKQAPMPDGPFKGERIKMAAITGGQVSALEAATGALRWTVELPAAPALDALALDRDGNALIGLQDGSVVSVGAP